MNSIMATGPVVQKLQAAFAEMERDFIRQRLRAGKQGGRSLIRTREKPRYAWSLVTDHTFNSRDLPSTRHLPTSTLYHQLHADETIEYQDRRLLGV